MKISYFIKYYARSVPFIRRIIHILKFIIENKLIFLRKNSQIDSTPLHDNSIYNIINFIKFYLKSNINLGEGLGVTKSPCTLIESYTSHIPAIVKLTFPAYIPPVV